ncbi:hypothetical protein AgCh_038309 [Apium graveolens]
MEKNYGPIVKPDKLVKQFTQLRPISINEMSLENLEKGQPSARRLLQADVILHPKKNYSKNSSKNPLDLVYATPKPDEEKLLGRSIAYQKDPRDSVLKKRIVKVYKHGKLICVMAGHPQFAEAKKEENVRLKQQKGQVALDAKNQAKKPVTIETEILAVIVESVNEEK